MSEAVNCCETCRYWDPYADFPHKGLCRRRAPSRYWGNERAWPLTHNREWCGDGEVVRDKTVRVQVMELRKIREGSQGVEIE